MEFWQLLYTHFLIQGFVLGLLGGVHCVYMCTPVALFFTQRAGIGYVVTYHAGRIWAYVLLGTLAGGVGLYFTNWAYFHYFSAIVGLIIIAQALGIFGKISFFKKLHGYLLKQAASTGSNFQLKYLLFGIANGFLPCGLSATAIVASTVTWQPYLGALFMLSFGLGTSLTLFSSQIIAKAVWFQKLNFNAKWASVTIGLLLVVRGLQLGIPLLSPKALAMGNMDSCGANVCVAPKP